jgi:IS30 family transposase
MSYKQLTQEKRYEIKAYMQAGFTVTDISNQIGFHRSTVYREIRRNRGQRGYRPRQAHQRAKERKKNAAKQVKLTSELKARVTELLEIDYSPEQISGHLLKHENIKISHEVIYQFIWSDKASGGTLYTHLRCSSKKKRKRYGGRDRRGQIPDRVSIDERPEIVDNKERFGDWEVDTIIGKKHQSALVTAVERKTKYTCIAKVEKRSAELVSKAIIKMLIPFKEQVHTITVDNGKEFANHKIIAKSLESNVYFAKPYCSWQRGLNENTNGLIRQYFPKKTSFTSIDRQQTRFVEDRLNNRPRKSLDFNTPMNLFINNFVALES